MVKVMNQDLDEIDLKKISRDLMSKIERIPQFEDKLGIKYENITIILREDNFSDEIFYLRMYIVGDVLEVDREKIDKNTSIITTATIYDTENYILYTGRHNLSVADFLGFDTFEIYVGEINTSEISKIRLFPK